MASLLFIAPADLGEAVLATGALAEALAAMDDASIVCTPAAAPLFRAAPKVKALHLWRGGRGFHAWLAVARALGRQRFDLVVDLSGSGAARIVRAERQIVRKRSPVLRHLVEEWGALLGAEAQPALRLDDAARSAGAEFSGGALLALAPGADAPEKRWPGEHFAAVARRLASGAGPLSQARIVLLGGGEDQEIARAIAASLDADGVAARNLVGSLDLLGQAALLEHATLFIGNDNALMHVAAVMNAPTLGLFGPSDERLRGPFGARARALRGRDYEAIMALAHDAHDNRSLMQDISVDAVEAAALELLRAGGLI